MPEIPLSQLDVLPQVLVKLAMAILCGLILGLERERKDKPAGIRTIVLITVGATLYMIVSEFIPHAASAAGMMVPADPGRVAAQVVTGIGFLGAGAIIRARGAIYGLTTAAIIWVAAAIGLLVGSGYYLAAVVVTVLVLTSLVVMDPLRRVVARGAGTRHLRLVMPNDELALQRVEYILLQNDVGPEDIHVERRDSTTLILSTTFHAGSESAARILEAISRIPGVHGMPYDGNRRGGNG